MSPTDKRTSGNPAKQAEQALTVKQQREQKRAEKLAEYQKQVAKRRRTGIMWWVVGGVAAVTIIGVVIASFVFQPTPAPTYTAGGDGTVIEGVETFTNETTHVEGTVEYDQNPPAGGPHNQYWLNCGIYTEPQQNENAVHSLEHGAIWVTYDPALVQGEELTTLESHLPSSFVILSPVAELGTPIALTGWNNQLKLDSASDERIPQFFEEFWRNQNVPEPNAVCSGAIDGPGKQ